MSNAEKALTGLDFVHYAVVTSDTDDAYATGEAIRMPGAMTWGADQSSTSSGSSVAADDNAEWYTESGSSANSETRDVVFGQIFLRDYALFRGGVYNEATDTVSLPRERNAIPKIAISGASLLPDNTTYRMIKYYLNTIQGVSIADITSRSGSASVANITMSLQSTYPKIEGADMVKIMDGPLDMAWLKDFTDYPTVVPDTP